MKRNLLNAASVVLATAMVSACGGGGGAAPVGATAPTAVSVNATNGPTAVQAVATAPVSFASGIADFGTAGTATTLTVSAPAGSTTPTFSVTAGSSTASGNMSFGSCIFTVNTSTFAAGSPLAVGARITESPCAITLNTAGMFVNGIPQTISVTLNLNGSVGTTTAPVLLDGSGNVSVNGAVVGKTTIGSVTGL